MKRKVIIGYQGAENSNNHMAAVYFAEKYAWEDAELLPLVSGAHVAEALRSGKIRYGVYAYETLAGGLVQENVKAMEGLPLKLLDRCEIPIHHQLFKKSGEVADDEITAIASHPEALRQCGRTLRRLYPEAEWILAENTATAARALAEGELPETTAVLCSRRAGAQLHLALILENAEDLPDNRTTFVLAELDRGPGLPGGEHKKE